MGVGPTVEKILKNYKGKVRLVLKMYPYKYRDFSHISAQAIMSAWDQHRLRPLHLIMIKNSPRLDRDSLIEYARQAGLDVARFTRELDAMKHKDAIERDKSLAMKLDLYNTPAFFINGRMLLGNRPYESFEVVINEELDAAGR